MYKIEELNTLSVNELKSIAQKINLSEIDPKAEKKELIYKILDQQANISAKEKSTATPSFPKKNISPQGKNNYEKRPQPTTRSNYSNRGSNHNRNHTGNKFKSPQANDTLLKLIGELEGEGVLDIMPERYGFLRSSDYNCQASPDDIYISNSLITKCNLKRGDHVKGIIHPPKAGEKIFGMLEVTSVNGRTLEELRQRKDFQHLVPLFPKDKLITTSKSTQYATRIIDLFSPIGKGQRGMIVSPPKAGKTTILKQVAEGISQNHPEVYLMVVMIGERPEEVTNMRRSVKAEVLASTFDEPPEKQVKVATMAIEKAKRMVECGYDVVMILDSLTRLARAYNACTSTSGAILSGGMYQAPLFMVKKFFGAARNIEHGGSLTIIASALVETGSRMDDVIFEELKGTGNMELQLSRNLTNKNIYPAIDIRCSSTRRGEDMQKPAQLKFINMLRRVIGDMNSAGDALKFILDNMRGTDTNEQFLASIDH